MPAVINVGYWRLPSTNRLAGQFKSVCSSKEVNNMTRRYSVLLTAALFASLLVVQIGNSQEKKAGADKAAGKTAEKAGEKKAKPEAAADKAKGRLPNFYGKLGLNDEQKAKIYDVQAKHRPEVEKLEEQLKALKAKETTEIDAVLTAEQRTKLAELQTEAQKKREAKGAKSDEAASADEEPAEKPGKQKTADSKAK